MRTTYEYYVKAFTEPSLEYIFAYLRVGLFLAVIVGVVWYFFLGEKVKPNVMVSFDEVDRKFTKDKGSEEKSETQGSTTIGTGGDIQEYRSMSLKREMDQKGPYPLTEDENMLTRQAYVKFQALMSKHVWIKFHITQREILENRYGLYQDRNLK